MSGQLAILAGSLVLLSPWMLLGWSLRGPGTAGERVAVGAAVGLGATVTGAHLLASAQRLDAFFALFALAAVAALGALVWRRRTRSAPLESGDPGEARWLALGTALVAAFALVPTLGTTAPIGWDPSFHAILAEKVRLANGLVHDWQPFEPIPLNYPLGSHLWVALNAMLSGHPVHHVFQVQHVVVQTLAAVLVFAVARRVLGCVRSALFAMLVYGLLGGYGAFHSYYQWGGLPTEVAFVLFLALLWVTLVVEGWRGRLLGVLLYGSVVLVHHLGALIITLVLAGYAVMALAARLPGALGRRVVVTGLATAVAYAPFIVPYALRARSLGGTHVLELAEEPRHSLLTLVDNLNVAVVLLGVFGLWLARARVGAGVTLLFVWVAILLMGYTGLDYGYRLYANLAWGRDITAFTPSRFATVLSYPLSIAAGLSLETLRAGVARRASASGGGLRRLGDERSSLALLVAALALAAVPRFVALAEQRAYGPVAEVAGAWVRQNAPEDALVLYQVPIAPRTWVPYLTWRAAAYTPIPASENRGAVARRHAELQALASDPNALIGRLADDGKEPWVFSMPGGEPHLEALR